MHSTVLAYIGLGSNLGESHGTILAAMDAIADLDGVVLMRQSSLYGSAPVDAVGADFVNAVVEVQTVLKPLTLLRAAVAGISGWSPSKLPQCAAYAGSGYLAVWE
jgi:2-amino-4-hydroxy-6-hydroxymethyldihydropteridine diphosphokinase